VVLVSMYLFVGPLLTKPGTSSNETCKHIGTEHTATIKDNKITPEHIQAKKCDSLVIVNDDTVTRLMAFGQHENHIVYSGHSEERLAQGQSFTVTLTQTGNYLFHDHYDESVNATFTVTN